MYVFISYSIEDKEIAEKVKSLLTEYKIDSFLAHKNIDGGTKWKDKIFKELEKADTSISIISESFILSPYCLQESGIAEFRKMKCIPLSIDKTLPPGFAGHIQYTEIKAEKIEIFDLLPSFQEYDPNLVFDILIGKIKSIRRYEQANNFFKNSSQYIKNWSVEQLEKLLQECSLNSQAGQAFDFREFYCPLLKDKNIKIDPKTRKILKLYCANSR